ncbi:MAG TPA: GAF domain-containing protein, partial [Candidatus Elarobacter sp.]
MSEATTIAEIGRAVTGGLEQVFGANAAALSLAIEEGAKLWLAGEANLGPAARERFHVVAAEARLPMADAYRARRPVWLSSPDEIARYAPAVLDDVPQAQTIGSVPLILRERALGAITLIYQTTYKMDAATRALLEDYIRQIALAVERALSYEDAQRGRNRLQLLADVGHRIAHANLDVKQVMENIVHEVTRARFAHRCAIWLRHDDAETLSLVALHHVDAKHGEAARRLLTDTPARIGEGIVGGVALTGTAVRVTTREEAQRRFHAAYQAYLAEYPISTLLAVPLRASRGIIGVLTASRDFPDAPFSADDEQFLLDLADRAALSIENALLYERGQRERERAESANAAKDEFLAMLGHELRNPLSPILTAAQLMRLRGGDLLAKERTIIERQVQ